MEFHISRAARERYQVDQTLFSYVGNVVFSDVLASRRLAARMTEVRAADAQAGQTPEPVNAGALFAMGLIEELSHAVIARYRKTIDPKVLPAALEWFAQGMTEANVETLLGAFTDRFPNTSIYTGEETVSEWLAKTMDDQPNREAALEELMLLWLANINPAYKPFRELFDDTDLARRTMYKQVTARLGEYFATRPPFSPEGGTLLDVLKAPMLASPDSLTGQLDYIRENWVEIIGDELRQVLLAIDVLREEEIGLWMRFHPPAGGGGLWDQNGPRDWGMFGFSGDEYQGFEGLKTEEERRRAWLASQGQPAEPVLHEYEAFSQDQAWMPTVVLIAKSTYVWLEQLSKQYGRHIYRLDQIPEEELRTLSGRGMNGLWLIGLWERSVASQTIKRMRGQHDAVASAYSLRDYRIAEDLGGEQAYVVLRDRCRAAGIRLASDMVPNHMGIDSTWVLEHPDWFVSRPESPFPVYSFNGPNLSPDHRAEIRIEDHYYDQTDAAVVFQLKHSGKTDYVYHGNDGTTFAWNDTAQLDYSKTYVREQVILTILEVARLFPIIRFDAAMVLAKKHVQRLWFPLPGEGRSIPSRAENAMTQEEFDALMPHEFWREVVDRVAAEVPGTLLLAEAFWLLEGYFVRTLGMHRVYNSAFMNMLRDEENAKYRSYLKKTIEFDPDILKRYVNFMSNPDERTAIDQFGSGDKYFGCCTLMATLPGLPMFGHGQVEAYTERYGMEYKQAKFDEWPNNDLVSRHQREIMPLLKNRGLFAESSFFRMYDFTTDHGSVDENVFAFSNREGGRRAIILFNNAYGTTHGRIHWSVEQVDKGSGTMRGETMGDAIQLPWDDRALVAYKDTATGLEFLRWSRDLRHNGLALGLRGYQYAVLLDWRELYASAEQPWDRLCNTLHGSGVGNLDEALSKLRVMPVHEALRQALDQEMMDLLVAASATKRGLAGEMAAVEANVVEALPPLDAPSLDGDKTAAATIGLAAGKVPQSVQVKAIHERLQPMLERIEAFYVQAIELDDSVEPSSEDEQTTVTAWERAKHSLSTIFQIPELEAAAQSIELCGALPIGATARKSARVWATVVAWSVLHQLAASPEGRVEIFDKLQLRAAIAQAFASLGLDHDQTWRAAARVRVLLQYGHPVGDTALLDLPESFWKEPDVRWLTGMNESAEKIYFNRELLEQMLSWMTLPTLAHESEAAASELAELMRQLEVARAAAAAAGYEVKHFLAGTTPEKHAAVAKAVEIFVDEPSSEMVDEVADPAFKG